MRQLFPTIVLLTTLPLSLAQSATLHVSKSGNGVDGTSWESAFIEIGDAIKAATSGDQLCVASGVYNESLRLSSGLSLLGGFSGRDIENSLAVRDPLANETVIDATSLNKRCILVLDATDVLIDGFTLRNANLEGDFGASGGGIALARSQLKIFNQTTLMLKNCLLDRNIGTAVRTLGTQVYLENCTFGLNFKWAHNDLFDLNAFPTSGPGGATVTNCIIRDNLRPGTNVTYSNVLDYLGKGNIDENPMWVDVANGDFHLQTNSPCIDSGTDVEVLNDLDGNPRPVDVKGRGIGRGFDMGCYEFQLKRADLNQDGYVNGVDLIEFQEEWMREGVDSQE